MKIERVRKNASQFGWPAALGSLAVGAANRVLFLRILRCMRITSVTPSFPTVDARYKGGFLDETAIRRLGGDPLLDMSESFISEALSKGDRCYGFLDGDRLINFGWYSLTPTKMSEELQFRFPDGYIYLYKAFTHPDYRGQRLHGIGTLRALEEYLARGFRGIVCHVHSNNFASLRSSYRMGFVDIGSIGLARVFSRYVIRPDRECRTFGVSVVTGLGGSFKTESRAVGSDEPSKRSFRGTGAAQQVASRWPDAPQPQPPVPSGATAAHHRRPPPALSRERRAVPGVG